MENVSNISSEEELLQLRNEGKISEAEYNNLLAAIRTPSSNNLGEVALRIDDARTKHTQSKIAFVLMLIGFIFTLLVLALAAGPFGERAEATTVTAVDTTIEQEKAEEVEQREEQLSKEIKDKEARIWSCLFLGLVLEIVAFVMGVISWPEVFAKATVVTISVISVIVVLSLLFDWMGVI